MNSLSDKFLNSLTFSAQQASVNRALGECRGKQQLYKHQRPELLDALLTVAKIESTDASNKLEGITASNARLEALVHQHDAPRNHSEQEIAGYRDALELIHQSRTGIEQECPDVSRETIRLVLRAMKKEGLVEPRGRGRGARWRKQR